MATIDKFIKDGGSLHEIKARYREMTGIRMDEDVLAFAALAARNWVLSGRTWIGKLDAWIDRAGKLYDEFPDEPADDVGAVLFNSSFLAVAQAYADFDKALREVRRATMFRACLSPPTGGRDEDTAAKAFALAVVWLWKGAGRPPPTPGPTTLLAAGLSVDTLVLLRGLSSPTRRWKNHLDEAHALVDSGDWAQLSSRTMAIHMLMAIYGGSPEAVVTKLTAPGYLDGLRERQAEWSAAIKGGGA